MLTGVVLLIVLGIIFEHELQPVTLTYFSHSCDIDINHLSVHQQFTFKYVSLQ